MLTYTNTLPDSFTLGLTSTPGLPLAFQMGFNSIDNGWALFDHVRLPLSSLLGEGNVFRRFSLFLFGFLMA